MIFHVKRIKYSEILFPQSWLVGGIGLSRFLLVGYGISILIGRLGWAKDDSDTQFSSVQKPRNTSGHGGSSEYFCHPSAIRMNNINPVKQG